MVSFHTVVSKTSEEAEFDHVCYILYSSVKEWLCVRQINFSEIILNKNKLKTQLNVGSFFTQIQDQTAQPNIRSLLK